MIGKLWLALGAIVVVAIGAAAYFSYGAGSHGSPLETWVTGSQLGQDIGTLEGDRAHVVGAVASGTGLKVVHTICTAMESDAGEANGELPSPDASVTQLLARAYGLSYDAAQNCATAPHLTSRFEERTVPLWDRASALFSQVLARVHDSTGKAVPTTTTTIPDVTGTTFL
ncbi:MAG: hypothetical protein ACRDLR_07790 [Gaiellaceae bacterium]